MTLPTDLSHIDPDLIPILQDLQAQITAIVVPAPAAFDPTTINSSIADLETRVTDLENAPAPTFSVADFEGALAQFSTLLPQLSPADLATLRADIAAIAPTPPPPDAPPVWKAVPSLNFVQGVASSIPITSFVSDPDGDPLTITETGSLPAGITFDGANFNYDGKGAVASAPVVLSADDGKP